MSDILNKIKKAIDIEIESIKYFRENIDSKFEDAVNLILNSKGKVILTGVGKSGDIAKKISSTLSSTGTPSFFLHPTDAAHGDAGIINEKDIIIAIGKSGESDELVLLIPTIKKIGAKLISITANPKSKLAIESNVSIITPILKEACPLELAPTSSTTIAIIAGDAIAMTLMEMKNFRENNFALFHPAGRLGKRLSLGVTDVMRKGDMVPALPGSANFSEILSMITSKNLGAAAIIDSDMHLEGMITDYDIRKMLAENKFSSKIQAGEIMNPKPISFLNNIKAYDVLVEMENREKPISVAPILDENGILVGIVSLHDLIQKGIK